MGIVMASLALMASAKPRHVPKVGFANGRIIGGHDAEPHAYPWQISMKSYGSHICGGSIINEKQVICAAHCVEGQIASMDAIVAGAHKLNFEFGHQKQPIETFKTDDAAIPDGTTCVSTGWGLTSGGGLFPPNTLQTVEIDILNQEECNELFQGYIKPGMICNL